MSIAIVAPGDEAADERWRLWRLAYAESSRRSLMQARIVIAVILTGLAGWLVLQFVSWRP